ncbi:breast cancer type 2 susceptibility protein homolog [Lingula anatina]|uniref:Breast cancer type 2 susceptibility protein homolog n=1 Tax=Lingula anatina TaxID=7574 RepID=A0A1S3JJD8_LINAN|nr:breast cancer type 2 susceptibility protein homolog [Lingula anatina]|eukprot:XP_013410019.1 breast cancer type 2 susceptibility protein homolog [Lingula anatina]
MASEKLHTVSHQPQDGGRTCQTARAFKWKSDREPRNGSYSHILQTNPNLMLELGDTNPNWFRELTEEGLKNGQHGKASTGKTGEIQPALPSMSHESALSSQTSVIGVNTVKQDDAITVTEAPLRLSSLHLQTHHSLHEHQHVSEIVTPKTVPTLTAIAPSSDHGKTCPSLHSGEWKAEKLCSSPDTPGPSGITPVQAVVRGRTTSTPGSVGRTPPNCVDSLGMEVPTGMKTPGTEGNISGDNVKGSATKGNFRKMKSYVSPLQMSWDSPALKHLLRTPGYEQMLHSTPNIAVSLGADPNDTGLSWTSSLATPPPGTVSVNSETKQNASLEEGQRKPGALARVLFSPGEGPSSRMSKVNQVDLNLTIEHEPLDASLDDLHDKRGAKLAASGKSTGQENDGEGTEERQCTVTFASSSSHEEGDVQKKARELKTDGAVCEKNSIAKAGAALPIIKLDRIVTQNTNIPEIVTSENISQHSCKNLKSMSTPGDIAVEKVVSHSSTLVMPGSKEKTAVSENANQKEKVFTTSSHLNNGMKEMTSNRPGEGPETRECKGKIAETVVPIASSKSVLCDSVRCNSSATRDLKSIKHDEECVPSPTLSSTSCAKVDSPNISSNVESALSDFFMTPPSRNTLKGKLGSKGRRRKWPNYRCVMHNCVNKGKTDVCMVESDMNQNNKDQNGAADGNMRKDSGEDVDENMSPSIAIKVAISDPVIKASETESQDASDDKAFLSATSSVQKQKTDQKNELERSDNVHASGSSKKSSLDQKCNVSPPLLDDTLPVDLNTLHGIHRSRHSSKDSDSSEVTFKTPGKVEFTRVTETTEKPKLSEETCSGNPPAENAGENDLENYTFGSPFEAPCTSSDVVTFVKPCSEITVEKDSDRTFQEHSQSSNNQHNKNGKPSEKIWDEEMYTQMSPTFLTAMCHSAETSQTPNLVGINEKNDCSSDNSDSQMRKNFSDINKQAPISNHGAIASCLPSGLQEHEKLMGSSNCGKITTESNDDLFSQISPTTTNALLRATETFPNPQDLSPTACKELGSSQEVPSSVQGERELFVSSKVKTSTHVKTPNKPEVLEDEMFVPDSTGNAASSSDAKNSYNSKDNTNTPSIGEELTPNKATRSDAEVSCNASKNDANTPSIGRELTPVMSTRGSLGKSRSKKFFYPTSSQISKTKANKVYDFLSNKPLVDSPTSKSVSGSETLATVALESTVSMATTPKSTVSMALTSGTFKLGATSACEVPSSETFPKVISSEGRSGEKPVDVVSRMEEEKEAKRKGALMAMRSRTGFQKFSSISKNSKFTCLGQPEEADAIETTVCVKVTTEELRDGTVNHEQNLLKDSENPSPVKITDSAQNSSTPDTLPAENVETSDFSVEDAEMLEQCSDKNFNTQEKTSQRPAEEELEKTKNGGLSEIAGKPEKGASGKNITVNAKSLEMAATIMKEVDERIKQEECTMGDNSSLSAKISNSEDTIPAVAIQGESTKNKEVVTSQSPLDSLKTGNIFKGAEEKYVQSDFIEAKSSNFKGSFTTDIDENISILNQGLTKTKTIFTEKGTETLVKRIKEEQVSLACDSGINEATVQSNGSPCERAQTVLFSSDSGAICEDAATSKSFQKNSVNQLAGKKNIPTTGLEKDSEVSLPFNEKKKELSSIFTHGKSLAGFSLASGKTISVSNKGLAKAEALVAEIDKEFTLQNLLEDGDNGNNVPVNVTGFTSLNGPQSAVSNKGVTEDKADVDRKVTAPDNGNYSNFTERIPGTVSDKELAESKLVRGDAKTEVALQRQHESDVDAALITDFTVADGKAIIPVSDDGVIHSKAVMAKVDDENQSTKRKSCDGVPSCGGFTSANGKEIKISHAGLAKARTILSELDKENEIPFLQQQKFESSTMCGFTSASGKKIPVSSSGLEKAKAIMTSIDTEISVQHQHNVAQFNDMNSTGGFTSASGKTLAISRKGLARARALMSDIESELLQSSENDKISERSKTGNIDLSEKPCPQDSKVEAQNSSANSKRPLVSEKMNSEKKDYSNVPKGFRPFKPPRIMAKKVESRNEVKKDACGVSPAKSKDTQDPKQLSINSPESEQAKNSAGTKDQKQVGSKGEETSGSKNNGNLTSQLKTKTTSLELECNGVPHIPNTRDVKLAMSKENISPELPKGGSTCEEFDDSFDDITATQLICLSIVQLKNAEKPEFSGMSNVTAKDFHKQEVEGIGPIEEIEDTLHFKTDHDTVCTSVSEDWQSLPKTVGFQTASGTKVTVSQDALKRAREMWKDCYADDGIGSCPVNVSENNHTKDGVDSTKPAESSTKVSSVSSEDKNSGNRQELTKASIEQQFMGFHTASGNKVEVSRKALLKAKDLWKECHMDTDNENMVIRKDAAPEKYEKDVKSTLDKVVDKAKQDIQVDATSEPLQTADQISVKKTVHMPDSSLQKDLTVQQKSRDSNTKPEMENGPSISFVGFQTASGKKVEVSDQALKQAKKLWEHDEFDTESSENITTKALKKPGELSRSFQGFQTASGHKVCISESALKKAKELWMHFETQENSASVGSEVDSVENKSQTLHGFHTASGNRVEISESSLKKARELWHEADADVNETYSKYSCDTERLSEGDVNISYTALGNKQDIAQSKNVFPEERAFAEKKMQDSCLPMFQTASGSAVTVSAEALIKAKKLMDDCDADSAVDSQLAEKKENNSALSMFYTVSDNGVSVSDRTMNKAKDLLEDCNGVGNVSSEKWKNKNGGMPMFQTASGNAVTVSDDALIKAKKLWNDCETGEEGFSELIDKSERKKDNITRPLFQTASGRAVSVSEKALAETRRLWDDNGDHDITSIERKERQKQLVDAPIFQTASGNAVSISEEALAKAKTLWDDFVVPCDEENDFSKTSLPQCDSSSVQLKQKPDVKDNIHKESHGGHLLAPQTKDTDQSPVVSTPKEAQLMNDHGLSLEDMESIKALLADGAFEDMGSPSGKFDRKTKVAGGEWQPHSTSPEGFFSDRPQPSSVGRLSPLVTAPPRDSLRPVTPAGHLTHCNRKMTSKHLSFYNKPPSHTATTPVASSGSFVTPYKQGGPGGHQKTSTPALLNASGTSASLPTGSEASSHTPTTANTPSSFVPPFRPGQIRITLDSPNTKTPQQQHEITRGKGCDMDKAISSHGSTTGLKRPMSPTLPESGEKRQRMADSHGNEGKETKIMAKEENPALSAAAINRGRLKQEQLRRIKDKAKETIRPMKGHLLSVKSTGDRVSLRQAVREELPQWYPKQKLYGLGVLPSTLKVSASNAEEFHFLPKEHFLPSILSSGEGYKVGDGATLILDDQGCAGKDEFYRAFLDMPGVDPRLVSQDWVYNHYRWIVWKMAAMEVAFPQQFGGRCLTPHRVMLQLKYRYDREVDASQRSAVKKITERDDTPAKTMILCVSRVLTNKSIETGGQTHSRGKEGEKEAPKMAVENATVELTDGWYPIRAQLDPALTKLLRSGKLRVGQKLCVCGAELVGSQDACLPLEAPTDLLLKVSGNSTRPARWDAILGFHRSPHPFPVPLGSLFPDGGMVGCVDVVVTRVYPIQYMEKLPNGSNVFRCGRMEERESKKFEQTRQERMERLLARIQADVELKSSDKSTKRKRRSVKLTHVQISNLTTGKEIYDAIQNAPDPTSIEMELSEAQICALNEHRCRLQMDQQAEVQAQVRKALQDTENEQSSMRNVTPLLKVRVAGCSNSDVDAGMNTFLTVWRPSDEVIQMLQEGKRLKIYNLSASGARVKNCPCEVQLSACRGTKYMESQIEENFKDLIFEPREVYEFSELCSHSVRPAYSEVDVVGFVVHVTDSGDTYSACSRSGGCMQTVYFVDNTEEFLEVKFWGGLKALGVDDLLTKGTLVAVTNLQWRGESRSSVPCYFASEMCHFTTRPKDEHLKSAVEKLQSVISSPKQFINEMEKKLRTIVFGQPVQQNDDISVSSKSSNSVVKIPSRPRTPVTTFTPVRPSPVPKTLPYSKTDSSTPNSRFSLDMKNTLMQESSEEQADDPRTALQRMKARKLEQYGEPPPVCPLPVSVPSALKRGFRAPGLRSSSPRNLPFISRTSSNEQINIDDNKVKENTAPEITNMKRKEFDNVESQRNENCQEDEEVLESSVKNTPNHKGVRAEVSHMDHIQISQGSPKNGPKDGNEKNLQTGHCNTDICDKDGQDCKQNEFEKEDKKLCEGHSAVPNIDLKSQQISDKPQSNSSSQDSQITNQSSQLSQQSPKTASGKAKTSKRRRTATLETIDFDQLISVHEGEGIAERCKKRRRSTRL